MSAFEAEFGVADNAEARTFFNPIDPATAETPPMNLRLLIIYLSFDLAFVLPPEN
jgi:hypothetical protein